jgi:uncharacterized protein YndB with AHSA1/START domain
MAKPIANARAARETGSSSAAKEPSDLDLVITRTLDAPREMVFAAWTENEHLERWQGAPEGFTVTVEESDIREGGHFKICMRSPDGVDHRLQGVYREITPPERLVFTHAWIDAAGKPGRETLVTITFVARGNRTELTLRQTGFESANSRDGHRVGWDSTLNRLARYLMSRRGEDGRSGGERQAQGSSPDGP